MSAGGKKLQDVIAGFSTVEPDPVAAGYARDRRVTATADGSSYTVETRDGTYVVAHNPLFGWGLYHGPDLKLVQLSQGGLTDAHLALGAPSAGGIIRALIGDPR